MRTESAFWRSGRRRCMLEAEQICREGTPVEAIDPAMRESIFPLGPFELGEQAGFDIAAGMFHTIAGATPIEPPPLVWKLREAKRFGVKSDAGIYDYTDGRKTGVWPGLTALVRTAGPRRVQG
jgi:3-hydroxyacyl-CoA dehydrogenase